MRRTAILATLGLLALVPAAHAGVPRTRFTVTPATASTASPITATWKVDRRLKRRETFGFQLTVVPTGSDGAPASGYRCATGARVAPRAVKKGRVLRATFRPGAGLNSYDRFPTWCPGTARILLFRYYTAPGLGYGSSERFLGIRTIPIAVVPGETVPFTPTPVKVTLLPGSTITASAPGRPDRSTPVTGVLRGALSGPFTPNRDIVAEGFTGSVSLASFAPDPLCPGTAPPQVTEAIGGSRLDVLARGEVRLALNLNGAASQVFGCGPPGPPAGATTLPLSGTVGPKGLLEQSLTGAVSGIVLPGGTQGGLAASLVLNIDLSGRG